MAAGGATDGLGAWQRGVGGHVLGQHLRELAGVVVHHVPVHAVAVRHLLMLAVPAGVEKHLVRPVLLWIQYVVAALHCIASKEQKASSVHQSIASSWAKYVKYYSYSRKGVTG